MTVAGSLDQAIVSTIDAAVDRALSQRTEIRLLDNEQVAERLALSPRSIERLISSGRLRSVVVGARSRRVRSDDLEEYIRGLGGGAE